LNIHPFGFFLVAIENKDPDAMSIEFALQHRVFIFGLLAAATIVALADWRTTSGRN
jgi:hypothetical protein